MQNDKILTCFIMTVLISLPKNLWCGLDTKRLSLKWALFEKPKHNKVYDLVDYEATVLMSHVNMNFSFLALKEKNIYKFDIIMTVRYTFWLYKVFENLSFSSSTKDVLSLNLFVLAHCSSSASLNCEIMFRSYNYLEIIIVNVLCR